MILRQNIVEF